MASKNRFQCKEIIVGYESTGPFGEPMVHLDEIAGDAGAGQSYT